MRMEVGAVLNLSSKKKFDLTEGEMFVAIKEAARMVKPGGSLFFTSFIFDPNQFAES